MELGGKIKANQTANVKFAQSGKLSGLFCKVGDTVKKGQLLAILDRTELQAYLDRSLKQYDLERALFDEKQKTTLTEYEKRKYQDSLDISVKDVEIAKINLDAVSLYSSISGIIVSMDEVNPNENITPAGFVITIVNPDSFYFEAELSEEDLYKISPQQQASVSLVAIPEKKFEGKVEKTSLIPVKGSIFTVEITLNDRSGLRPGLSGKVLLT